MARIATSQTHTALQAIIARQQGRIVNLQQQVASGLKIHRASDDPVAAAQAERARAQLARLDTERRTLQVQRSAVDLAEHALGQGTSILQNARDTLLRASNSTLSAADRASLGGELKSLRGELLAQANRVDTQGVSLFGGLGTAGPAFVEVGGAVRFRGTTGQAQPGVNSLPQAMDGRAVWMDLPQGNGVFTVNPAAGNQGSAWADVGSVIDPAALTGHDYSVSFAGSGATATVTVTNQTTGAPVLTQAYKEGQALVFDGMSLILHGAPKAGDSLALVPAGRSDIFATLDAAAQALAGGRGDFLGAMGRALTEVDAALQRVGTARSQTGEWMRRGEAIESAQQDELMAQQQALSVAQDADMVSSISALQAAQSGMDAALKSYAQVQNLSLFNYLK